MIRKQLILILLSIPLSAMAQTAAEPQAPANEYPCEEDPAFAEFDFWLGHWEVRGANGQLAGQNHISREQHGCLLIENWTSATGGTGMSINYLDKTDGKWVQVWNDGSGSQINIRGGLTDDGMQLEGTIHYVATNETKPFRGLWTLMPDGRVRQFFEQSEDQGASWATWFEGFYTRQDGRKPGKAKDTD